VAAVQKEFPNGSVKPVEISEEEFEGLREAQEVFRDLAARMRAFALNERLALWFVQWRYDPWEASEALFGVPILYPRTASTARMHIGPSKKQQTFRMTK
jgi:hypothetical protein